MEPNNPYPGTPGGNPYEFILNPAPKPKKSPLGGLGGNRLVKTALIIIGSTLLIMIILTFVLNATAPKRVTVTDYTNLAQSQTELMRISGQANGLAVQQVTRNLATTVEYTMITQRKQTLDTLGKEGVEVSPKELALKQNASTDQRFSNAKVTSTFDKTYTEIIQKELETYASTLRNLSDTTNSATERDRMSDYYRQVQQLLSQVPYTEDSIDSAGTAPAGQ